MKINNKFLENLTRKLKFFNQVDWSVVLNARDLLWLRSVQKTENQKHKFHLVSRSPWPILASMAGSSFLVGLLFWLHKISTPLPLLLLGFILVCLAMYLWFRDIIREGTYLGYHTRIVQRGLRIGFILFLVSEVMFFFSFFWAYFHSSLNPSIWIGAVWPPEGIVHFFTEKSVSEAYFNLLTLLPDAARPRLILFDANSDGGRLVYKNKYNGHFKTYSIYPDDYKPGLELVEPRNDVRIATMIYSEFVDNVGLNFTFLAKNKIRQHELELVYRRLFNNNIKSKYLDYAIRMGKVKTREESVLRAADIFAECKALQFQVSPDKFTKTNFLFFNTFYEKYPYEPATNFKDKILPLLNPQTTDHFLREKLKISLALKILTNDYPHAGLENTFEHIELRYFADAFAQRARFNHKTLFASSVDYLLLGRRYDFFRSVVTNLVLPILKEGTTLDSTVANIFIKQFKNKCIQHLVVNSNPIVEELEQDLILTHFAFLNYENLIYADVAIKGTGVEPVMLIGSIPPLSFFFLSNPYALDLTTTRSDFRDVDSLSDRVEFRASKRHRKTLLSYLFLDAKENLISVEEAAAGNVERSDHSFDNYCGNDCIECFLHSDFYAQLHWIRGRIRRSPYPGLRVSKYQTRRVTEIAWDFIAGFKNNYDFYADVIRNSGLIRSNFFNIYGDTMDFMLTGLYNESNMFQEIMINNIYHQADFYDKSADYSNTFVFFITDFSLSSAIWNFIAAGHSLKILKQANSLTAHAIIARFVFPELGDTTIFPRASIKYEFRLFDHGCLINPSGVPWLNTILLITSGMTVTVSHIFFKARRLNWSISFLLLTIILSIFFLKTQCLEYIHSSFAINDSVYGSAFYMLTGFHGFHVIVGTIFLIVCLVRLFLNHFHKNGHLGFEAAIWYWHFVDVIWIGLYFFVYFWPNNYFFHSHYVHNHSTTPNFKIEELSYSCPIRSIDLHRRPKEWDYDVLGNLATIDEYFGYKDFHLPCGQSSKCLLLFSLYKYDLKLDGLLCNMFVFSRKEVDLDWIEVSHQVRERIENKGIVSWYGRYRLMGLFDGTLQKEWKHGYFKYCDNKILYNPRWTKRKKNYWEEY